MNIEIRREHNDAQVGGDVVVSGPRRWVRFALYIGSPPGSHIGYWRTRVDTMRGWNFRFGRRYIGPCVTVFVHTRPARAHESTH